MKQESILDLFRRYGLGLACLGLSISIRYLINPWVGTAVPFTLVYIAVLFTCWNFGLGPAILNVVAGFAIAEHLFVQTPVAELTVGGMLFKFGTYSILNIVLIFSASLLRSRQDDLVATRHDLLEREELLRSVCDGMADAVFVRDLQKRFLVANPAAVALFNRPLEALLGQTCESILETEEAREFARRSDAEVLESGVGKTFDVSHVVAGIPRDLHITKTPQRNRRGEIIGTITVVRDITEQKRMHDMLHQSQKMEALGQLSGGVAHDFNNLLTLILGYAERLRMSLRSDSPQLRHADSILKAAYRARDLTGQLLAFSRGQIVEPRTFSVNESLRSGRDMIRRLIGEHIRLDLLLEPRVWSVNADPGQFLQMIINLAVNGRDAMPDGGDLTIKTENRTITSSVKVAGRDLVPGDYVVVSVRDSGCGMEDQTRERIFEPFFTTKDPGKGTGLGLSMVYGVVTDAGGGIEVETAPGAGSVFRIFLPRSTMEIASKLPVPSDAVCGGDETILLVEDERSLRELAAEMLREQGYTVIEAEDPADAISKASTYSGRIDLLLTDVIMPGMHGRTLAEQMQSVRAGMKVLYMSGYTDDEIVRRGVRSHEVAFVPKPFTHGKLLAEVRAVLDAGRASLPQ